MPTRACPLMCMPGMGDGYGVKVPCGRWFDEALAEGNWASASERREAMVKEWLTDSFRLAETAVTPEAQDNE